jgi:hypothetical protein
LIPQTLLTVLMAHGSPGETAFSVESAAYCMRAFPPITCAVPTRYSSFYGGWVHKERRETAEKRLELAARTLISEAQQLLCVAGDGTKLEGCTPYPGVVAGKRRRWNVENLTAMGAAVAQLESGFREDVMVGRGWARKPSDDGGRGRGPSGEGCLMQIHPSVAWRFADISPELYARAKAGDREAREAVVQSLLGADEYSLRRCWRTGLRMLIRSRAHCDWAAPGEPWDSATVSMFGTGTSCVSANNGKTGLRVRMFRTLLAETKTTAGAAGGKD